MPRPPGTVRPGGSIATHTVLAAPPTSSELPHALGGQLLSGPITRTKDAMHPKGRTHT